MSAYKMSCDVAHQIAVGLYQQAGNFITAVKRDNPDDYERFKAAYLAKQSVQAPTAPKRRHTRNRPNLSR